MSGARSDGPGSAPGPRAIGAALVVGALLAVGAGAASRGCDGENRSVTVANLERRVEALEAKVREMDATNRAAAAPPDPEVEHARRLRAELDLLGRPAPPLAGARWVQGTAGYPDGRGTLVVFFSPVDPAARAAVAHLRALLADAPDRLAVVGVSAPATDAVLRSFLAETGATFPVAVDPDGGLPVAWARSASPSAALVVRGEVAWTGAPTGFSLAMLDKHR